MTRATENDVAFAILQIAAKQKNKLCTFNRARKKVPDYINLSPEDLAESDTRTGEALWHQLIRNIRSHHGSEGNYIADGYLEHVSGRGYRATKLGKKLLEKRGL